MRKANTHSRGARARKRREFEPQKHTLLTLTVTHRLRTLSRSRTHDAHRTTLYDTWYPSQGATTISTRPSPSNVATTQSPGWQDFVLHLCRKQGLYESRPAQAKWLKFGAA